MTRLACVLALICGCATVSTREHDEAYASNTIVANSLVGRMGVEPAHGQVTVVVASGFFEKLLQASVYPNKLVLSVASPGQVWKQTVHKLAFRFDNVVALTKGSADIDFAVDKLALHGDIIGLHGSVKGHGVVSADMTLFGVGVQRDLELWTHYDDGLQLHLEKGDHGWLLRPVGAPFKLHVDVDIPALTVGVFNLFPIRIARDLEWPADSLGPFELPLPTPQTVHIGWAVIALGIQNMTMGTREGLLWVGADLVAGESTSAAAASPAQAATPH